jgi:WD40 repeat protein
MDLGGRVASAETGKSGPRHDLALLRRSIRRESYLLAKQPDRLASHLHNMLWLDEGAAVSRLLSNARASLQGQTWLRLRNRPPADRHILAHVFEHGSTVWDLAWAPRAQLLASAGADGRVLVWELAQGTMAACLDPNAGHANALSWSPCGEVLASGHDDGSIRFWNGRTFAQQRSFETSSPGVLSLAWSPDGRFLAVGHAGGRVTLGNRLPKGGVGKVRDLGEHRGHQSNVHALAWSPGARSLATGDAAGVIRMWHGQTLSPGPTLIDEGLRTGLRDALPDKAPEEAIQHQATIFGLSWSPDGSMLASGTRFGTIRLWNPATGEPGPETVVGASLGVPALDWSPEGRLLAWGTGEGRLALADPLARQRGRLPLGHAGAVWSLKWSPAGGVLASGGEDGMVRLWSARELWRKAPEMPPPAEGHGGSVLAVSWSGDGTRMVSSGADLTARYWDTTSGHELGVSRDLPAPALAMTPSPQGTLFASMMGSRETVKLWKGPDETPQDLTEITGPVFSLALSPDGRLLASGDSSETIWLRDITNGEPAGVLLPPDLEGSESDSRSFLPVWALGWSPDGRFLASAAEPATIIWDSETRRPHRVLRTGSEAHREATVSEFGFDESDGTAITADQRALAWSPDGSQLAWRGPGTSICVWDSRTDETRRLEGHAGKVYAVGWSANGRLLASASSDRTVRLWNPHGLSCLAISNCLSPVVAIRFAENGVSVQAADDGTSTSGRPLPYLLSIENLGAGR